MESVWSLKFAQAFNEEREMKAVVYRSSRFPFFSAAWPSSSSHNSNSQPCSAYVRFDFPHCAWSTFLISSFLWINVYHFPLSCPVLHRSTCCVRANQPCRPFMRWRSWPQSTWEKRRCWRAPIWAGSQPPAPWRFTPSSGAGCTFAQATLVREWVFLFENDF